MTQLPAPHLVRRTAISIAILVLVVLIWISLAIVSDAFRHGFPGLAVWVPLGLFGIIRWSVWVARKVPAMLYRPITEPYRTSASIVVPVYQEDPEVFRAALASWLDNRPDELIVIVDATDSACQEIAAAIPGVIVIVTDVPGKRDALARGIRHASSEIVVLVDSDTIFEPGVLERVLRPFADPRIAGVGTRQRVLANGSFWQRIAQIYLDIRYDIEAPALTRVGRAVSCLSGRTAAYRRAVIEPLLGEFMDERFLGKLCVTGEDKRLTSLVLKAGYDTYHQDDAVVRSTFPPDVRTFLNQRVRWSRNTYRSDLRALWEGWVWQRPYLAFMLVDRLVSPYALLIGLVYFVMSLVTGHWPVAVGLAAWWLVSRAIKLAPHLRREPRDILIVPAYIVLTFGLAVLKVYALATVHHHRWLTRQVEVVNGEVVRAGGRARDRTALPVRVAGVAIGLVFAVMVTGSFVVIGGLSFTPEDTSRPNVRVAGPASVPAGEVTQFVATAVDRFGGPLQYVWTLDGELLSTEPVASLPPDLTPGTYSWTVHVRDGVGNTASVSGTVAVRGETAAASSEVPSPAPTDAPASAEPSSSPAPTRPPRAGEGTTAGSALLPDTALSAGGGPR